MARTGPDLKTKSSYVTGASSSRTPTFTATVIRRTIMTRDLDLARGTLAIHRDLLPDTVHLEELSHRITAGWLDYPPSPARLDQSPPAR
ncbi:hypothetical protein ABZ371_06840 [Streptomyces sp. NPDC005899]|uniref:hypothetical protein n=1 Tax=Streptomyces sp. NPDC005899 TaxID=3155716 RepID=UPI0033C53223